MLTQLYMKHARIQLTINVLLHFSEFALVFKMTTQTFPRDLPYTPLMFPLSDLCYSCITWFGRIYYRCFSASFSA